MSRLDSSLFRAVAVGQLQQRLLLPHDHLWPIGRLPGSAREDLKGSRAGTFEQQIDLEFGLNSLFYLFSSHVPPGFISFEKAETCRLKYR